VLSHSTGITNPGNEARPIAVIIKNRCPHRIEAPVVERILVLDHAVAVEVAAVAVEVAAVVVEVVAAAVDVVVVDVRSIGNRVRV
jgi:hypothetical protein